MDSLARRERLGRLLHERATLRTAPLTPAQRRLWFLEQLDPHQPTYHIPWVQRLHGRVDETALELALNDVVARHEALRSVVYLETGEPRQRVHPDVRIELARIRLPGPAEPLLADALAEQARQPFDLAAGPLLRATLVTSEEAAYLAITVHHLTADGWSLLVVARELADRYAGLVHGSPGPPERPPPLQYPEYADWLDRQLSAGAFDRALEHFRGELEGAPPWIELPTERAPSTLVDWQGAVHRFEIGRELVEELEGLLREEKATLYMGLLAAFAALLCRLSGQNDVVIGSPVANRNRLELEDAVGLYANVVVRRMSCGGRLSFRELVGQVRERVLSALPFQELPFERLVEAVNPPRDLGRNPLFQVLFTLQNAPRAGPSTADAGAVPAVTTGRAQFELALTVQELDSGLRCSLEYPVALFSPQSVEQVADRLVLLLSGAVREPDVDLARLPVITATERDAAVRAGDGGPAPDGPSPIAAVRRLATASPESPAVLSPAGTLTFEALEDQVGAWAARLRRAGVGVGDAVFVSGERTPELVAVFLGILRLGAVYVPVDPALPAARVRAMAEAVRPRVSVASPAAAGWSPESLPLLAPCDPAEGRERIGPCDVPGEGIAYIVFTSGSTGPPKPVAVSRAAMENHCRALQTLFPLGPGDLVLLSTNIGFDAAVFELLGPLAAGAGLAAALTGPGPHGADVLVDAVARYKVTALQVVPSTLRALLDEPGFDRCRHLRQVYCGGEMLTTDLQRRFRSRSDAMLINMYGPTETAIDATSWPTVDGDDRPGVPIGRPIPGTHALVVDSLLEPVPVGVAGELLVGGSGVALGYLGDPALTALRFPPDPYGPPGSRAYLTGDLVRRRDDGVLDFVGRRDGQVKIRGLRVELGEIETALRSHASVSDAVAVVGGAGGGPALLAGVVGDGPIDLESLRRHLLDILPLGLQTASLVVLDAVPLTAAGKVDRAAALAAITSRSSPRSDEPPLPGDEERLAELWCELLGVSAVHRHDSFFELGGHSLLATRLASRVRLDFGVEFPIRELFAHPTLANAAARIAQAMTT